MRMMIWRIVVPLAVLMHLTGCGKEVDGSSSHGKSKLNDDLKEEYQEIGSIGIGDAYRFIRDDNIISNSPDKYNSILNAKAIVNGSYLANSEYALELYNTAITMPRGSYSRDVLIKEAENRLELATKNLIIFDFVRLDGTLSKEYKSRIKDDMKLLDRIHDEIESSK